MRQIPRINRRWRWRTLGVLALLLVVVGPAAAQEAETKTYEAKFYPFSLTWSAEVWKSSSSSRFNNNEQLEIEAGATVLFLRAYTETDQDERGCMVDAIASVQAAEGISALDENDELPMPENTPAGSAEALLTYTLPLEGRETPVTFVQYLSCLSLGDGAMLLVGAETRAGIYEEELEIIDDALAGLDISAS